MTPHISCFILSRSLYKISTYFICKKKKKTQYRIPEIVTTLILFFPLLHFSMRWPRGRVVLIDSLYRSRSNKHTIMHVTLMSCTLRRQKYLNLIARSLWTEIFYENTKILLVQRCRNSQHRGQWCNAPRKTPRSTFWRFVVLLSTPSTTFVITPDLNEKHYFFKVENTYRVYLNRIYQLIR